MAEVSSNASVPKSVTSNILNRSTFLPNAAFWTPRHIWPSRSLRKLPFIFWLVENFRPNYVVQVGLSDGISFLGICQAIDKKGLESSCIGYSQINYEHPPAEFHRDHEKFYYDFSILKEYPDDVALWSNEFSSLDMIVVGENASSTMFADVYGNLFQKAKEGSLFLVLDPSSLYEDTKAKKELSELSASCLSILPLRGHDAPLLFIKGDAPTIELDHLAKIPHHSAEHLEIVQVFEHLGKGVEDSSTVKNKEKMLGYANDKIDQLTNSLNLIEEEISYKKSELNAARASEKEYIQTTAILKFQIQQLKRSQEEEKERNSEIKSELKKALDKNIILQHRVKDAQTECRLLSGEIEQRVKDIAILARDWEKRYEYLENQYNLSTSHLETELQKSQNEIKACEQRIKHDQIEHDNLKNEVENRVRDIAILAYEYEKKYNELEDQFKRSNCNLEAELQKSLNKIKALERRIKYDQSEHDSLKNEVENRVKDIGILAHDYKKKCDELENQLTKNSKRSMGIKNYWGKVALLHRLICPEKF